MVWYTSWNIVVPTSLPHHQQITYMLNFCTDQAILTPKILIIIYFNLYLYYLHNFNQNFNFHCYEVMVAQLTKSVHLYSCNNNITLKMAGMLDETCW